MVVAAILFTLVLVQGVQAAEPYNYVTQWGSPGSGNGQFNNPEGIAVNSSGYVYVTDTLNYRVQVFNSTGNYSFQWGSQGSGNQQFKVPGFIAVNSSNFVYVADGTNNRILVFTPSGAYVTQWNSSAGSSYPTFGPAGVAINSTGYVYVVDHAYYRILVFNPSGTFVREWGASGSSDGYFNDPAGIAVDSSDNIYVADRGNYRIQKFTPSGGFIGKWGSQGSDPGFFQNPSGIAVDNGDNVFVVDNSIQNVQVFTSSGSYVTRWGTFGTGNGEFEYPYGIAVDSSDNIYVVEMVNNRVQKFVTGAVTGCQIINTPGSYLLQNNIPNSGATKCIEIRSSDVTFDGNGYTIDGTDTSNTDGIYISNDPAILRYVTVKNVVLTDWGQYNAGIKGYKAENCTITNNKISSAGNGIDIGRASNSTISWNNVSGNSGDGIIITYSDNVAVTNNTANNEGVVGIALQNVNRTTVYNNTLNNDLSSGIYYTAVLDSNFTQNTLQSNGYGIDASDNPSLGPSARNVFINNTLNSNTYDQIRIDNSSYNIFSNNTVLNIPSSRNGIILYPQSTFNIIGNNTFTSNNGYAGISIISGADSSIVSGNTFIGNLYNGIGIFSSNNTLAKNRGTGNYYFTYIGNSNNRIFNNTALNNNYGFGLESATNNLFQNNTVKNSTGYAVWFPGGTSFTSTSNTFFDNYFFNNTNIIGWGNGAGYNIWNTSKTTGTNIIGGSYLGGNYWAQPDGTGYSQLYPDTDGDGFSDGAYTIATANIDNLPLTPYTGPVVFACKAITSPGTYTLQNDILDSSSSGCIGIQSSDVIFNGNSHTIDGLSKVLSTGVSINPLQHNITITNLTLTDWHIGVYGYKLNDGTISDNTFYNNSLGVELYDISACNITGNNLINSTVLSNYGIYLNNLSYSSVSHNKVNNGPTGDGIYLQDSSYNNISYNSMSDNGVGLSLYQTWNNNILNNNASGNNYGIYLNGVNYYTVVDNNTVNSNSAGIWISGTNGAPNTLSNNTIKDNADFGVILDANVQDILIINNTVSGSSYGIELDRGSKFNNITVNTITGNSVRGINISASSSNTIYNNYFNNPSNAHDDYTYNGITNPNSWNLTSKTPGTNIIGGSYLGGNSWNDYTGVDTNGDGLGNTLLPYNNANEIIFGGDYLPLTNNAAPAIPAPVAAFSGTPTSGTVPLAVTFTDASTGILNGWAWFFGDEDFTAPWTQVNVSSGWMARDSHSSVAMPDGSIVLMGGRDSYNGINDKNDVWRSMDNGATWTLVNASAGWTPRHNHNSVAMPDGSIVLMGGQGNFGSVNNDVWRSMDNGATWTLVNASAGWTPRWGHSSVAMPDGNIVLMGGYASGVKNDTWRSTDNGATWTLVNASAGWTPRWAHSSVAMPDGSIVLMGGQDDISLKNDVWRSTDNGATWTEVNTSAGWTERYWQPSVAMPDGSIVLMGGYASSGWLMNDMWRSTNSGTTWTQVNAYAGWTERYQHSSVAMPNGSIVLMGGRASGGAMNDTWRFNPTGSSLQNPSHTYTAAGKYNVSLQAFNSGGYNSTRKAGYITVTGPPAPVHNLDTHENFSTIQAAINAVNTTNGNIIEVDPGIYTDNIKVNKSVTLRSSWGNPDDTVVQAANPNKHVFEVTSNNVTISGFTVKNATSNAGISLSINVGRCNISDNIVTDNLYGILLATSSNNRITNNTVLRNNGTYNSAGILLVDSSENNTIANNNASMNYNGIELYHPNNNNTISDNLLTDNIYAGFLMASSNNNTIANNIAVNNTRYGICLWDSDNNNSITNNTVSQTQTPYYSAGIFLSNSKNNTITNNIGSNNVVAGIELMDSYFNNIHNNTVSDNNGSGIYLVRANNNTITNNYATNNPTGIYLETSSTNNSIANNIVWNNTNTGIGLNSLCNYNSITNNIASNNTNYGIALTRSEYNTVTNNTASNSPYTFGAGFLLYWSNNNTITNNNALNNAYGIYLWYPNYDNTISNNTVSNNTNYGIRLDSSCNNTITNNTALNNNGGIQLSTSSNNNTLKDNTVSNNIGYDFYSNDLANNNIITNLTISNNSTTISFTYNNGTAIKGVITAPVADPAGKYNISKFVNITKVTASSWISLNMTYEDADLGELNEHSLSMWRYNATGWSEVFGSEVYTDENIVTANISLFSIFAPLAELNAQPVANFTANVTSGTAPLAVQFNDTSTSPGISSWNWIFGDIGTGNTSALQNPSHTYTTAGTYSVNLTVTNSSGSDSEIKPAYITVNAPYIDVSVNGTISNWNFVIGTNVNTTGADLTINTTMNQWNVYAKDALDTSKPGGTVGKMAEWSGSSYVPSGKVLSNAVQVNYDIGSYITISGAEQLITSGALPGTYTGDLGISQLIAPTDPALSGSNQYRIVVTFTGYAA